MASHENLTEREGRSRRRLPSDQDKEMKKDGRIKRFLCNVLQLRVLVYIATQPASFLFILSLLVIALCLPFLGAYIKTKPLQQLPDLDSMRVRCSLGHHPPVYTCTIPNQQVGGINSDVVEGNVIESKTSHILVSQAAPFTERGRVWVTLQLTSCHAIIEQCG